MHRKAAYTCPLVWTVGIWRGQLVSTTVAQPNTYFTIEQPQPVHLSPKRLSGTEPTKKYMRMRLNWFYPYISDNKEAGIVKWRIRESQMSTEEMFSEWTFPRIGQLGTLQLRQLELVVPFRDKPANQVCYRDPGARWLSKSPIYKVAFECPLFKCLASQTRKKGGGELRAERNRQWIFNGFPTGSTAAWDYGFESKEGRRIWIQLDLWS